MPKINSSLVDTEWVAANLGNDSIVVLDASVAPVVPGYASINTEENFAVIPGARRFDYDGVVCKPNSSLPHMMPTAELFSITFLFLENFFFNISYAAGFGSKQYTVHP